LTPYGSGAEILRLFANGKLILCYDSRILDENEEVLNRKRSALSLSKEYLNLSNTRELNR